MSLDKKISEDRLRSWMERHGKWLTLTTKILDRTKAWFGQRGKAAVLLCRMVPALGTAMLAYAVSLLGQNYDRVSTYIGPVIGGSVASYVWRLARQSRRSR